MVRWASAGDEERARAVRCPFCGVGPGERCVVLGRAPGTEASSSHRARVRAAMPELAMLPALTGEELDVLGRALMDRLVIASAVVELDDDIDDGRRQYWAHEAAVAQSLATAVAEARYSLDRGLDAVIAQAEAAGVDPFPIMADELRAMGWTVEDPPPQ